MDLEYQNVLNFLKAGVLRVIPSADSFTPEGVEHPGARSHNHRQREILFVLEGESDYMVNGNWHRLKHGDAVFIESWQEHSFFYRPDEHDLKHLWLFLHPKRLNAIYSCLNHAGELKRKVYLEECSGSAFQNLVVNWDRARNHEIQDDFLYQQLLRTSLNLVLLEITYKLKFQESVYQKKPTEEIIAFVLEYIDNHHGNHCSLQQLARLTGYTHYYLCHLFRKYCGKTIGTVINEARLAYIIEQKGRTNVKELAEKLGFASVDTFWKWRRTKRNQKEQLRAESVAFNGASKEN